ncbi:MAG: ABC transporter permease [Cypionkella sp.]
MIRFLAGRIAFAALILFALSTFVFFLFFVAPGDPARMVAGDKATEAQLVQIRSNLGLDRPIYEQYGSFLVRAAQGDLGFSYRNQQPVLKLIANRLPATISLVIGGVVVWLALGIPIGIMSARHPGGLRDRLGQGFILIGLSFPTFVLGMVSLYVFYFLPRQAGFTLFPAGGFKPFWPNPAIWAWHMALPWMTVALTTAAVYARLTRGQMLEVMGEDYIRTARAKGLPESRVVLKHAMRATLTPLVTQLGADIAFLLGGAIVIEQVYGLQGVGALAIQAVNNQDRPIIIGVVLLGGLFIVIANIIVDIAYALLDPRVRQQ